MNDFILQVQGNNAAKLDFERNASLKGKLFEYWVLGKLNAYLPENLYVVHFTDRTARTQRKKIFALQNMPDKVSQTLSGDYGADLLVLSKDNDDIVGAVQVKCYTDTINAGKVATFRQFCQNHREGTFVMHGLLVHCSTLCERNNDLYPDSTSGFFEGTNPKGWSLKLNYDDFDNDVNNPPAFDPTVYQLQNEVNAVSPDRDYQTEFLHELEVRQNRPIVGELFCGAGKSRIICKDALRLIKENKRVIVFVHQLFMVESFKKEASAVGIEEDKIAVVSCKIPDHEKENARHLPMVICVKNSVSKDCIMDQFDGECKFDRIYIDEAHMVFPRTTELTKMLLGLEEPSVNDDDDSEEPIDDDEDEAEPSDDDDETEPSVDDSEEPSSNDNKAFHELLQEQFKNPLIRKKCVLFSATFGFKEEDIERINSGIDGYVMQKSLGYAIENGYAVPYSIIVPILKYSNPDKKDEQHILYLVKNMARLGKTVIFTGSIKKANAVCEALNRMVAECAVAYHSEDNVSRKGFEVFENGNHTFLVTVNMVSAGFNYHGLQSVVFFGKVSGNWKKAIQRIGRGCRTFPGKTNCNIVAFDLESQARIVSYLLRTDSALKEDLRRLRQIKVQGTKCRSVDTGTFKFELDSSIDMDCAEDSYLLLGERIETFNGHVQQRRAAEEHLDKFAEFFLAKKRFPKQNAAGDERKLAKNFKNVQQRNGPAYILDYYGTTCPKAKEALERRWADPLCQLLEEVYHYFEVNGRRLPKRKSDAERKKEENDTEHKLYDRLSKAKRKKTSEILAIAKEEYDDNSNDNNKEFLTELELFLDAKRSTTEDQIAIIVEWMENNNWALPKEVSREENRFMKQQKDKENKRFKKLQNQQKTYNHMTNLQNTFHGRRALMDHPDIDAIFRQKFEEDRKTGREKFLECLRGEKDLSKKANEKARSFVKFHYREAIGIDGAEDYINDQNCDMFILAFELDEYYQEHRTLPREHRDKYTNLNKADRKKLRTFLGGASPLVQAIYADLDWKGYTESQEKHFAELEASVEDLKKTTKVFISDKRYRDILKHRFPNPKDKVRKFLDVKWAEQDARLAKKANAEDSVSE